MNIVKNEILKISYNFYSIKYYGFPNSAADKKKKPPFLFVQKLTDPIPLSSFNLASLRLRLCECLK